MEFMCCLETYLLAYPTQFHVLFYAIHLVLKLCSSSTHVGYHAEIDKLVIFSSLIMFTVTLPSDITNDCSENEHTAHQVKGHKQIFYVLYRSRHLNCQSCELL